MQYQKSKVKKKKKERGGGNPLFSLLLYTKNK